MASRATTGSWPWAPEVTADSLLASQHEGRRRFLELVADLRPELHRYCARMTGSTADGEDIVQDTLARAYYLLPEMTELPAFRTWLFRIAHNRALDHLKRYLTNYARIPDWSLAPAWLEGREVIAHRPSRALRARYQVELNVFCQERTHAVPFAVIEQGDIARHKG